MNKSFLLFLLFLACCLAAAHAQVVFQKTYGGADVDAGNFVHPTADGGYAISAYTYSFAATGWADIYVIKTDSDGNMLWSKNYGLAGNYENGGTICPTADSGLLIVGYVATPNEDIFLIKTNINGDTMWTKVLATGVAEHPTYVRQARDGGYIITGIRDDTLNGDHDILLLKTNNTGNVQWAKVYGGSLVDYGNFVLQSNEGGYLVGGYTESFGAGKRDIYVIKVDSIGNIEWSKTYGGSQHEYLYSPIKQTQDSGFVLAGTTSSFGANAYIIKTKFNGDTIWSKGFSGLNQQSASYVEITNDNGFILVGTSNSFDTTWGIYLIKTNAYGNSGCNQNSTNTIITTPATPQYDVTFTETFVTVFVDTPATLVGSGGVDSTLCYDSLTAVVEFGVQRSALEVEIYPNPFSERTTIGFQFTVYGLQLEIYDVLGNVVHTQTVNGKQETVSLHLPAGIYFYKVNDGNQTINGGKLMIIH